MADQSDQGGSQTGRLLSQCKSNLDGENTDIQSMLKSMIDLISKVDMRLTAIEKNTSHLEKLDRKIGDLERKVEDTRSDVKEVKEKYAMVETSVEGISSFYDDVKKKADDNKREIHKVKVGCDAHKAEQNSMKEEIENLKKECEMMKERMIDARSRSMKYNLIFNGIEENENEDCEETLKTFLKDEMKVEDEMTFVNVHRIGKKDDPRRKDKEGKDRPRSIIAKFSYNKDLVKVKKATVNLKGKGFFVNEQHPEEIEKRRKKLYPIMKEARKDKKNKVVLIRDKLFINNVQVKVDDTEDTVAQSTPQRPPRNKRARVGSTPEREYV